MSSLGIMGQQVTIMTLANMKARYRKTIAGFIWVVSSPILMYLIQSLVFKKFLKLDVPDYALFLLGGLLPWIFITNSLVMTTPIFATQNELLKSFKLSPFVLLFSQVLDNFFNFIFAFLFLLIPLVFWQQKAEWSLLLLPLAMLQLLIGTIGFVSLFSIMQVFFKDIRFVLPFVTNILFFLTPIFYPIEIVPEHLRSFIAMNPLYMMIDPFRASIYSFHAGIFWPVFFKGLAVSLTFAFLSYVYWRMKKNEFYLKL